MLSWTPTQSFRSENLSESCFELVIPLFLGNYGSQNFAFWSNTKSALRRTAPHPLRCFLLKAVVSESSDRGTPQNDLLNNRSKLTELQGAIYVRCWGWSKPPILVITGNPILVINWIQGEQKIQSTKIMIKIWFWKLIWLNFICYRFLLLFSMCFAPCFFFHWGNWTNSVHFASKNVIKNEYLPACYIFVIFGHFGLLSGYVWSLSVKCSRKRTHETDRGRKLLWVKMAFELMNPDASFGGMDVALALLSYVLLHYALLVAYFVKAGTVLRTGTSFCHLRARHNGAYFWGGGQL